MEPRPKYAASKQRSVGSEVCVREFLESPVVPAGDVSDCESYVIDVEVEPEVEDHVADSSSSNSSSDTSSQSSDKIDEDVTAAIEKETPTVHPQRNAARLSGDRLFYHKLWKTIHRAHVTDASKLACGRFIHAGYSRITAESLVGKPNCTTCFGTSI